MRDEKMRVRDADAGTMRIRDAVSRTFRKHLRELFLLLNSQVHGLSLTSKEQIFSTLEINLQQSV